ncbi:response regulator [Eubacteriales bacterium OttesenSCG-928-N13]|nr:response regulator [Eubacteriales bacterium OttesenSCG-928-N13]
MNQSTREYRWLYVYNTLPIHDEDKKLTFLYGSILDISDQITQQNELVALQNDNVRLEAMLEGLPFATLLVDKKLGVVDCNLTAVEMGEAKSKAEFIANYSSMVPEYQPNGKSSRDVSAEMRKKAFEEGKAEYDFTYQPPSGKPLHGITTIQCIDIHNKQMLMGTFRDLTQMYAEQEKVKEAEKYARLMLDATPFAFVLIDENLNMIDCNETAVSLLEYENKDDLLKNYYKALLGTQPDGSDTMELVARKRMQALETGGVQYKLFYTLPSGEMLPTEATLKGIMTNGRKLLAGYMRDLREIEQANERLKTAQEVSQSMLDHSPYAVFAINEEFEIFDCNKHAFQMYGVESKDDLLKHVFTKYSAEYQENGAASIDLAKEYIAKAFANDHFEFDWMQQTARGEPLPVKVESRSITWADGEKRVLIYQRDMRAIFLQEAKTRELQKLQQSTFDEDPLACLIFNNNCEMIDCNLAALNLYGATSKEDLMENAFTKYSTRLQPNGLLSAEYGKQLVLDSFNNNNKKMEWNHRHANGEIIPVELIMKNIQWDGGERRVFAYGRDLREVKASWAAVRAQQKELIKARDAAQASERSKSEFLANMSHEIRTPMTAIIGMTEIGQKTDDVEKMKYCLKKVSDASDHLLGVINDILDISKIESGHFELSYTDFAIERMLMRITDMMTYRVDQKKQDFIIKVDSDVPSAIISDQQRLTQLIMNLLSNANKFTDEHGEIILHIGLAEPFNEITGEYKLLVEVQDNGIGISRENMNRIFNAFEQEDNTISRRFGGTGLGLVIGKTIATQMGGELWVESELGKGSKFSFTIITTQGIASAVKRINPNIDVSNVNIMVVDDSEMICDYFAQITSNVGIACTTATKPQKAFEIIQTVKPNIMFIDFLMPDMDGIELTRQIRKRYGDGVVVIMISGISKDTIEQEALKAGVDKFIAKPLLSSSIIDCINTCLGQSENVAAKIDASSDKESSFAGRRVLMAEDVAINSEIVMAMLAPIGVEIDWAENGEIACEMFKANPLAYDLILMDIHMPKVDGFEATRRIRSMDIQKAKEIPIIALTANAFKEDVERCLDVGMNDHLAKPFNYDDFYEKISYYLKRTEI